MKLIKTAALSLTLAFALVAATAPADALIRNKDVKAVKSATTKITSPIVGFFRSLFHK